MSKVKKVMAGLLVAMIAVVVLSGCTNWKKKFKDCEIAYSNVSGQLETANKDKGDMAQQLAALQKQIADGTRTTKEGTGFDGKVEIDVDKGTITVILPDTVLFDSGKADLKRASIQELDQIISTLKTRSEYAGKSIDIVGHTDSDPISKSNWKDNWELSAQRALTVLRYMSSRGLPVNRLRAIGCGEARPIVSNTSASNKARNRRVEVVVHMR